MVNGPVDEGVGLGVAAEDGDALDDGEVLVEGLAVVEWEGDGEWEELAPGVEPHAARPTSRPTARTRRPLRTCCAQRVWGDVMCGRKLMGTQGLFELLMAIDCWLSCRRLGLPPECPSKASHTRQCGLAVTKHNRTTLSLWARVTLLSAPSVNDA